MEAGDVEIASILEPGTKIVAAVSCCRWSNAYFGPKQSKQWTTTVQTITNERHLD